MSNEFVEPIKWELAVMALGPKKWRVVRRPIQEGPIDMKAIHVLFNCKLKLEAVAYAEGRSALSGERIRMA